jgi:hypothetical protein
MTNVQDQARASDENPLLAARPPATDPITYLTIVEYNLSEENLPVLHDVLQDAELTSTIGWDLIHLLLPLLPASEECLQDIATKGNPRECVLKVTEALRLLEFEERQETEDEEDDAEEISQKPRRAELDVGQSSTSPGLQPTIIPPLPVLKFEILLDLLATLHLRVKTKYPSRFMSTSLQAALVAFNRATTNIDVRDEEAASAFAKKQRQSASYENKPVRARSRSTERCAKRRRDNPCQPSTSVFHHSYSRGLCTVFNVRRGCSGSVVVKSIDGEV